MKGYKGICAEQGKYIPSEKSFAYAMERVKMDGLQAEFEQMVVDWYFSGNWVPDDE